MIKHGFIKKSAKHKYWYDNKKKVWKARKGEKIDPKDALMEVAEEQSISTENYQPTGFVEPGKRYRVIREAFSQGIEESYFWILNYLRQNEGFSRVEKITDIFSASENSSFFGSSQQRIGLQQDKVSQYLRGISEMIKQLFQLVRELRIIDERLTLYEKHKVSKAADNTLKGLYIDLVEGGTKNPGSVLGLASQVGYTILPDLFFNSQSHTKEEVDKEVDSLKYNNQVKSILRRKLYAYLNWVEKTHEEHKVRKKFQLQYLRQHWTTIQMYMNWIKPYLKNISRLTMNQRQLDSPYLIGAFETSMTEIEILAYKDAVDGYHPCILAHFEFRTKPAMNYSQDYQRGPQHVGRVTITLRSYAWDKKQIEAYKRMKNEEDMELLGLVDNNVKSAMEALGEEFEKYLREANAEFEEKESEEVEEKKKFDWDNSVFGPFVALGSGFKEIFKSFTGWDLTVKGNQKPGGNPGKALGGVGGSLFRAYKFYKKSHGMLTW